MAEYLITIVDATDAPIEIEQDDEYELVGAASRGIAGVLTLVWKRTQDERIDDSGTQNLG